MRAPLEEIRVTGEGTCLTNCVAEWNLRPVTITTWTFLSTAATKACRLAEDISDLLLSKVPSRSMANNRIRLCLLGVVIRRSAGYKFCGSHSRIVQLFILIGS